MESFGVDELFKIKEAGYLSPQRVQWMFKEFYVLNGFIRSWSETFESLKQNKVLYRYLLKTKRIRKGQIIFCFKNKKNPQLQVLVCTTVDTKTARVHQYGCGWVMLIDERSRRPFFWFALRRTRYFMERMVSVVQLFLAIMEYWPKCSQCGQSLQLVQVRGFMLMRAFNCLSKKKHLQERPCFYITAMKLPEKYKDMLKDRFDQFYMYRKVQLQQGHEREYQVIIRSRKKQEITAPSIKKIENREHIYADDHNPYLEDGKYYD